MIFSCPSCKSDLLGDIRCDKCPHISGKLINISKEEIDNFDPDSFRESYPVYFKKYLRENGAPREGVIYQYKRVFERFQMSEGVFLDFGCALSHASDTVKSHSKDITYIGTDLVTEVLLAGMDIYEADYLVGMNREIRNGKVVLEDKPLKFIEDDSVDLLMASRIAYWSEQSRFLPEFYRVLRPGGGLFFWSNAGHFDNMKYEMFRYLIKHFEPVIKNKSITNEEALSKMLWGSKTAYKGGNLLDSEFRHRFRGLMIKKGLKDVR